MRKITSLTLAISGFIELITSVVLYILPAGRVAYWADYRLMGLSKTQWADIHITVGTLFLVAAMLHILLNWRPITNYMKNKAKKITIFTVSFNIALILSLYVTVGTLFHLPPMNTILQWGEYFTDSANRKYGEPPYGHAELSSLKMFCSRMNIDPAVAMRSLAEAGIQVEDVKATIQDIARENNLTPQQLYQIIRPAVIEEDEGKPVFPDRPAPGFGKKSLEEICRMYGLAAAEAMKVLEQEKITAAPEETVKEIASNNNTTPMAIFEILHGMAKED